LRFLQGLALIDKKPEHEGNEHLGRLWVSLTTWADDFVAMLDMGKDNFAESIAESLLEACHGVEMIEASITALLESLWSPLRATSFG
jgi:hypothetical protein